jgi:ELWxxDGT repeat protein
VAAITPLAGVLYFSATDAVHGTELWRSDGTEAGTYLVKDIVEGEYNSSPQYLVTFNTALYFKVKDSELWKSSGTAEGTTLVATLPGDFFNLTVAGDRLYFSGAATASGTELWVTDGTEAGTQLIDINQNPFQGSEPQPMCAIGNELFFAADDGEHGIELFKASSGNVTLVKDINPTGNSINKYGHFLCHNGLVYFSADDGVHSYELWRSDGTFDGTYMVKDINTDGDGTVYYMTPLGSNIFLAPPIPPTATNFGSPTEPPTELKWSKRSRRAAAITVVDLPPI